MPKHDGSGPNARGPITGRGGGYCVISINTTEEELEFLRNKEQVLKKELKHIKTRINKIEVIKS